MRRRITAVALLSLAISVSGETCYPQKFSSSSVVCVCNSTNCADIGPVGTEDGKVTSYQSSMGGKRFQRSTIEFLNAPPSAPVDLTVNVLRNTLQEIIGFGGAFTDAAGVNWASLSEDLRNRLLLAYFGPDGLEYNVGRIPMAGCDFSTRDYTYADTAGDFELKNFALAEEDLRYKIPMIQFAKNVSRKEVYLFGSPWSAPAWMKTSGTTYGSGALKGSPGDEYHKTWANYFVKFYEAYKEKGAAMWGFTIQNEPTTGFLPGYKFQAMAQSPYVQRDFLRMDLGPALFNATKGEIKLMVLDDNRFALPWWANVIYSDPAAKAFAAGVAVHWYQDNLRSSSALDDLHKKYPEKFILNTEACEGFQPFATSVILGSWERAETYAKDIMDDLRHYVGGWVDWNLCLDTSGGPNWVNNVVDSPIIVDQAKQTFYKQPMYYALGHFSKFLPRGSVRLDDSLDGSQKKLLAVTFLRPDHLKATVILNQNDSPRKVMVKDVGGRYFVVDVKARSMVSTLW